MAKLELLWATHIGLLLWAKRSIYWWFLVFVLKTQMPKIWSHRSSQWVTVGVHLLVNLLKKQNIWTFQITINPLLMSNLMTCCLNLEKFNVSRKAFCLHFVSTPTFIKYPNIQNGVDCMKPQKFVGWNNPFGFSVKNW